MRSWLMIGTVCAALAVVCPSGALAGPLFSAAAPHADGEEGGEKVLGVQKGLFKGAVEVTLWTILVFVGLVLVLQRTAWQQIREGLDKRENDFASKKKEAELARKEAEDLREKLRLEMAKVNEQIRTMMDKARSDAQATASEELARGKAELQAERDRMLREVRMSSDAALKEIWEQSAQLATLISAKAVRKQLSYDDHRRLLDEALNEFRAAAQTRRENIESARA